MKRPAIILLFFLLSTVLQGCFYLLFEEESPVVEEYGLRPVYTNDAFDLVKLEDPRPLQRPGKIYLYEDLLLINEKQTGLHIFNNSNPSQPVPTYFLSIPGCNDMAIRNDVIYVDQHSDLLAISLKSLTTEIYKTVVREAFQQVAHSYVPPEKDIYYECPNPAYGVVVDWLPDTIQYPCYNY